jgi:hypothetical protein
MCSEFMACKVKFIVPSTVEATRSGRNSGCFPISTSASQHLSDSLNLHMFGNHFKSAFQWDQLLFHIVWFCSSFGGLEMELLGGCLSSRASFLVRALTWAQLYYIPHAAQSETHT